MAGRHKLSSLTKISLDMNRAQVRKQMGKPDVVPTAKRISDDQIYQLEEYRLYNNACLNVLAFFLIVPVYPICPTETYWLHYLGQHLVFWGKADDWQGVPKSFDKSYRGYSSSLSQTSDE